MNKNFTPIKWILIVLIGTISNGILYAKEKPMTPIWERQVNNCKESYIFSAFSNNFVIISGTGKTLLGTYTHESVKNSDRVKLSLMVAGDNGVSDCFNNTYDSSRKTLILYSFYNIKTHMLQLSETKTGDYFGSFSEVSLLDN